MMPAPVTQLLQRHQHQLEAVIAIEPSQPCFAGHFEGWPVLAGVVQIDWVMQLARQHLGCKQRFLGLQSVKFQQLVRPPLVMELLLEYVPQRGLLRFSYRHGERLLSTGGIKVEDASA